MTQNIHVSCTSNGTVHADMPLSSSDACARSVKNHIGEQTLIRIHDNFIEAMSIRWNV